MANYFRGLSRKRRKQVVYAGVCVIIAIFGIYYYITRYVPKITTPTLQAFEKYVLEDEAPNYKGVTKIIGSKGRLLSNEYGYLMYYFESAEDGLDNLICVFEGFEDRLYIGAVLASQSIAEIKAGESPFADEAPGEIENEEGDEEIEETN